MAIEPQKEPGKQAPQPDVQPGRTPMEIPQDKNIPEKETPPMQLAPGRGAIGGASGLSGMLCYSPSDDGTPAPGAMLKNLKGIGPWPIDGAGDETQMGTRKPLSECYFPSLRARLRYPDLSSPSWE
jgi:hypothetical protein